jgi:hypothetical protein
MGVIRVFGRHTQGLYSIVMHHHELGGNWKRLSYGRTGAFQNSGKG